MRKGIFITATDTGVGKTYVGAAVACGLRMMGVDCGVMKPVQSGAIRRGGRLVSQDAQILIEASGVTDGPALVNPYCFKAPLAPSVAAEMEAKRVSPEKIISAFRVLSSRHRFMVVEGAGGLFVPLTGDYLMRDLILDLSLPVLIVSHPRLGTINHTLLTVEVALNSGIEIAGIVFNQAQKRPITARERANPGMISGLSGAPVLGVIPHGSNDLAGAAKKIDLLSILGQEGQSGRPAKGYLKDWDRKYLWHPFTQMRDYERSEPVVIEEAKGSYLRDIDGNRYLDGVSSLWVNVHGHRERRLDGAVRRQLNKVAHSTLLGLGNEPSIELAKRLIDIAPKGLKKVFYSDSGSTAVEIALKMAFQYWQHKGRYKKKRFITFINAYHGDTLGSVSVGGIDLFHRIYKPLLFKSIKLNAPYCYRCHMGLSPLKCKVRCLAQVEAKMRRHHKEVAALIIEPLIQAAAGMITQPRGFLRTLRRLCDRYEVLLIFDEVATGFGRTGKMFACEHEAVSPDILCVAKSISGGYLPLAATLATEEVYSAFLGGYSEKKTFFHGHTYTGNPLACSAAVANLKLFEEEDILRRLRRKIEFLRKDLKRFSELEHVGEVRQLGMMVGIELVKDRLTREPYRWEEGIGWKVIKEARAGGVILRPLGNVIVLMPPLNISTQELQFLLDAAYDAVKKATCE